MRKSQVWAIIFVIIILVLMFIIAILTNRKEANRNVFEFNPSLVVENNSGKSYVDTIALVVLDKIFKYNSITVVINDMPRPMQDEFHSIAGFITVNPFTPRSYYLFVDPQNTGVSNLNLIAHEMHHLRQYESGRMNALPDNKGMVFDGDTIIYAEVPYAQRAFEIEATKQEYIIAKQLNKLIYNR